MPNDSNLKHYLTLHFIVLIWGSTAVIGALISMQSAPLVWYRLTLTIPFLLLWIMYRRINIRVNLQALYRFAIMGSVIAIHWMAFFHAIKISNVSVTLITLSTGAFFTALIEPAFFKRKINVWEVLSGLSIIIMLYLVFRGDKFHLMGMLWALLAAITSSLFAVLNGLYVDKYDTSVMTFYEFGIGAIFVTLYLTFTGAFNKDFFIVPLQDMMYLLFLSVICTAYTGVLSIKILKFISPFIVMLSINLEPIYGMILALLVFGDKERMTPLFYTGAAIILIIVVLSSIFKIRQSKQDN